MTNTDTAAQSTSYSRHCPDNPFATHKLRGVNRTNQMIMSEYSRELVALRKFDELRHWEFGAVWAFHVRKPIPTASTVNCWMCGAEFKRSARDVNCDNCKPIYAAVVRGINHALRITEVMDMEAEWRAKFRCRRCGKNNPPINATRNNTVFCAKCADARYYEREVAYRPIRKVKRKQSIKHQLSKKYRNRLYEWLGGRKNKRTSEYMGCTVEFFREWIASQFKRGMSWDNWRQTWEIDHIQPLGSLDPTNPRDVAIANHYTNFRPLWKRANRNKGAKIDQPQLSLLLNVA